MGKIEINGVIKGKDSNLIPYKEDIPERRYASIKDDYPKMIDSLERIKMQSVMSLSG